MMRKLKEAFPFRSVFLSSLSQNYHPPSNSPLSPITSSWTFSHNRASSSTPNLNVKNSVLADYLIHHLKLSSDKARSVSSRYPRIISAEKPEKVVCFFKDLGFSDAHIQCVVCGAPQVLFADVEHTLKPKLTFFQELGLSGPRICSIISKNPGILKCSLDKTLKPCINLISKVLEGDLRYTSKEQVNDRLFRVLTNSCRIVHVRARLKANIQYLESCGVVGSQLSSLLLIRPRIVSMNADKLPKLISWALDMNFPLGSRMFVHAIRCLSCMNSNTLNGRFEVFRMFGFSEDELASMFRKSPYTFGLSEGVLRYKIGFFLRDLKFNKSVLVQHPVLLAYNIEERILPRYKVFEMLTSKRLLKEGYTFSSLVFPTNQQFLEKYILRFENDAEELLSAYNGKLLHASEK